MYYSQAGAWEKEIEQQSGNKAPALLPFSTTC
jgi:hypothetical protein